MRSCRSRMSSHTSSYFSRPILKAQPLVSGHTTRSPRSPEAIFNRFAHDGHFFSSNRDHFICVSAIFMYDRAPQCSFLLPTFTFHLLRRRDLASLGPVRVVFFSNPSGSCPPSLLPSGKGSPPCYHTLFRGVWITRVGVRPRLRRGLSFFPGRGARFYHDLRSRCAYTHPFSGKNDRIRAWFSGRSLCFFESLTRSFS